MCVSKELGKMTTLPIITPQTIYGMTVAGIFQDRNKPQEVARMQPHLFTALACCFDSDTAATMLWAVWVALTAVHRQLEQEQLEAVFQLEPVNNTAGQIEA